jgi:hypothetical protein
MNTTNVAIMMMLTTFVIPDQKVFGTPAAILKTFEQGEYVCRWVEIVESRVLIKFVEPGRGSHGGETGQTRTDAHGPVEPGQRADKLAADSPRGGEHGALSLASIIIMA